MLVLSRKKDQKLSFPDLGITVQILRIAGATVRVGVDAPLEVRIIREELGGDNVEPPPPRNYSFRLPQTVRHELRNQLNSISIALQLYKQELDAGYREDAEATFDRLVALLNRASTNKVLSREGITVDSMTEMRTLLVEDEPNEREMLAGFLRMHGCQVATVADGYEAIDYLESHMKPSVVLMDMRMPRCDGPTTIRRIRKNPAFDETRIFAISGSTAEEIGLNTEKEGVNEWFTKPLNPKSLVDAMAVAAHC